VIVKMLDIVLLIQIFKNIAKVLQNI